MPEKRDMRGQFPPNLFDFGANSNARKAVFCSGVRIPIRAANTWRFWLFGRTAPDSAPTIEGILIKTLTALGFAEIGSTPVGCTRIYSDSPSSVLEILVGSLSPGGVASSDNDHFANLSVLPS